MATVGASVLIILLLSACGTTSKNPSNSSTKKTKTVNQEKIYKTKDGYIVNSKAKQAEMNSRYDERMEQMASDLESAGDSSAADVVSEINENTN